MALFIAVACCTKQPSLEGSKWSAQEINGDRVERRDGDDPDQFTILFMEEQRIAAIGACNRIMGSYNASEDGTLDIESAGSTMMFCPDLDLEEKYVDLLDEVTRYSVVGDKLTLYRDKEVIVVFERAN